jgi:DNA topoisomerase-1
VTWLASWTENVQGQVKYVMLNPSSKLKGEKDWQKYETARQLAKSIDKIRAEYREDWKSKEMRIRQRAVALYFIDIVSTVFTFQPVLKYNTKIDTKIDK